MSKDLTKENVNIGNIIYEWWVREYEQHDRSRRWYIVSGLIGLALIVFALFTANYIFAVLIVLFAIVLYLHELQEPLEVYFAITDVGIVLGRKFYRFSELSNFWIIYNPPEVKSLYFTLGNVLKHRLQVPLTEVNPVELREYLMQYLEEDLSQEDEPASDKLARVFKIH